jgi:hypothetical protein
MAYQVSSPANQGHRSNSFYCQRKEDFCTFKDCQQLFKKGWGSGEEEEKKNMQQRPYVACKASENGYYLAF